MGDLVQSMQISASGMKAQSDRLKVIAQNIANADSIGQKPGDLPYRRKVLSFHNRLDRELGIETVQVKRITTDKGEFGKKYDPTHPAADKEGYVLMPNVNPLIEMVDMKEARRSYEANINMVEVSKSMLQQTLSLLR